SSKGGYPSVVAYCIREANVGPNPPATMRSKLRTGKESGEGSPPPKEITSGCCVNFRISRMALPDMPSIRRASPRVVEMLMHLTTKAPRHAPNRRVPLDGLSARSVSFPCRSFGDARLLLEDLHGAVHPHLAGETET